MDSINGNSEIEKALNWWNDLPIQNLEKPEDSWSGYCMKYFPSKTDCQDFDEMEILYIWQQENKK